MQNLSPKLSITHGMLQLIAAIERNSGQLDIYLERGHQERKDALQENALSALAYDHSTPAEVSHPIRQFLDLGKTHRHHGSPSSVELGIPGNKALSELHSAKSSLEEAFSFTKVGIEKIHAQILGQPVDSNCAKKQQDKKPGEIPNIYRTSMDMFLSHENKRVFTTVSPFLVQRRLDDLISWTTKKLHTDEMHPLVVISIFHLLFLQLHPFKAANHRSALCISFHLCNEQGFPFVNYSDFIGSLFSQPEEYYSTLKLAERSTFTDWKSLSAWVEYFLLCARASSEQSLRNFREEEPVLFSKTQEKIISIIKEHGIVSREILVSETGMSASTLKYNLSILSEKGHLIREGAGRSTSYRLF